MITRRYINIIGFSLYDKFTMHIRVVHKNSIVLCTFEIKFVIYKFNKLCIRLIWNFIIEHNANQLTYNLDN